MTDHFIRNAWTHSRPCYYVISQSFSSKVRPIQVNRVVRCDVYNSRQNAAVKRSRISQSESGFLKKNFKNLISIIKFNVDLIISICLVIIIFFFSFDGIDMR